MMVITLTIIMKNNINHSEFQSKYPMENTALAKAKNMQNSSNSSKKDLGITVVLFTFIKFNQIL